MRLDNHPLPGATTLKWGRCQSAPAGTRIEEEFDETS
jgi:hypothetical protein